jgi:hypothetical protein
MARLRSGRKRHAAVWRSACPFLARRGARHAEQIAGAGDHVSTLAMRAGLN